MNLPAADLSSKSTNANANQDDIRVMIVDDSVVIRGLVAKWVEEETGLKSVGKFSNGLKAVEGVRAADPDIIVLDIEMPVMDGLEALPQILKVAPDAKVIMASTLTQRNAEISLQALSLGAADYLPKPVSNSGVTTSTAFRRELIEKIKALAPAPSKRLRRQPSSGALAAPTKKTIISKPEVKAQTEYKMRPYSTVRPRVLVIGSSTGGPPALIKVMEELKPVLKYVPVLITQHMPSTFTGIFSEHIAKATGVDAHEGRDGEPLKAGTIYIAPGGRHMIVEREGTKPIIRLTDGPEINFCKPAVDPLFNSVSSLYGPATLAAVFTGMGSDGAKSAVTVADSGGSVIAQDEATSVVWGMPGATAKAGACCAILPLNAMAQEITQLIQGIRK